MATRHELAIIFTIKAPSNKIFIPIMLESYSILIDNYHAQNYAGIIGWSLVVIIIQATKFMKNMHVYADLINGNAKVNQPRLFP